MKFYQLSLTFRNFSQGRWKKIFDTKWPACKTRLNPHQVRMKWTSENSEKGIMSFCGNKTFGSYSDQSTTNCSEFRFKFSCGFFSLPTCISISYTGNQSPKWNSSLLDVFISPAEKGATFLFRSTCLLVKALPESKTVQLKYSRDCYFLSDYFGIWAFLVDP